MKLRSLLVACGVLFCDGSMLAQARGTTEDRISGNWGDQGLTFLELKSIQKPAP